MALAKGEGQAAEQLLATPTVPISEASFRRKSPLIQRLALLMRSLRLSPRTEDAYLSWIVRFIFHFRMRNPADMGAPEVTEYLSWLATEKKVSASTQNQAFNALLFLYNRGLEKPLDDIKAKRARREPKLPVWLDKSEVAALFDKLTGSNRLMAMLAYGTGVRLMELLRLRVKDVDFSGGVISVYQGKGGKNRLVPLPKSLVPALKSQILKVSWMHGEDLAAGFGSVFMPDNLDKKWPHAAKKLEWQYLFPAKSRSFDKRRGVVGRHHAFETGFQQALARAGVAAGIQKHVHPHCLRHSHATALLEMGRSIEEVRARLGHKNVTTTQIYLHCVQMKNAPSPVDCLCSH